MKQILSLILFVSLGFSGILDAQHHCSTVHTPEMMKRLEANVANTNQTVDRGRMTRLVPVHFHVGRDSDGSSVDITEEDIINDICILNERYEPVDILFYIKEISFINSTTLNRRPGSAIGTIRTNKDANAMNIFLVSEILDAQGNPTGAAGYYSGGFNNDFIVMLKTTLGDAEYTTEHEVGHFFSLAHTHVGWEGNIAQGSTSGGYQPNVHGDTVRITVITGSTQAPPTEVELVDGSNCSRAGDRICDTPPDYGFGQACGCCSMVYDVWDRNGDMIEPMIDNVMSYSNGCDPFLFTAEQILVMQTDYDSPSRAYLRNGSLTEYTPIRDMVNIVSPQENDNFDEFNGVLFEWEPVNGADAYIVNLSGSQQLSYETTDTELFVTDLNPNGIYLLDVYAYNAFGTGCLDVTRVFFSTGAGTTSIEEIEAVESVIISPNPLKSGETLNVRINATERFASNARVYNLEGRLVTEQRNLEITEGSNIFKLGLDNIETGLYIFELSSEKGKLIEKFIVE